MKNRVLALLLFLVHFGAVAEGEPSGLHGNLLLKEPAFVDRLTQGTVYQTFQDSQGALWFVSQEGLNRYIGHELETYRQSSEPGSLPANIVTSVEEDAGGTLWVSTIGGGIASYNPVTNKFLTLQANPNERNTPFSNDVFTLFQDSHELIWLGYNNGYSTFDPETKIFDHHISGHDSLPFTGKISSFAETSDGTIWAATETAGLLKIEPSSHLVVSIQHKNDEQESIVPGSIVPTEHGNRT